MDGSGSAVRRLPPPVAARPPRPLAAPGGPLRPASRGRLRRHGGRPVMSSSARARSGAANEGRARDDNTDTRGARGGGVRGVRRRSGADRGHGGTSGHGHRGRHATPPAAQAEGEGGRLSGRRGGGERDRQGRSATASLRRLHGADGGGG